MMTPPPPPQPHPQEVELRPLGHDQQEIVWEMLMHAAHETSDVRDSPLLAPYGAEFGLRTGDFGVVAYAAADVAAACSNVTTIISSSSSISSREGLQPLGAAWVRLLRTPDGFAQHVADDIPELAMAVLPDYQGRGIGSLLLAELMRGLMHPATAAGVSLSCRTDNPAAMRLYEKLGFTRVLGSEVTNRVGGTSVSMVRMFPTN